MLKFSVINLLGVVAAFPIAQYSFSKNEVTGINLKKSLSRIGGDENHKKS
jgi:hypothetical protein